MRASSRLEATRTSISAEASAGHHVGGRAPLNDADVDGGSRGQVLQILQTQNLAGELDDGIAALLGSHARVGGPPSTSRRNRPTPLREVLSPPSANAGSSTNT